MTRKPFLTREEFLIKALRSSDLKELEGIAAFVESINDDYDVDLCFVIKYDWGRDRVSGFFKWYNPPQVGQDGSGTTEFVTIIGDDMEL